MCLYLIRGRRCKIPSKDDYCHIHGKNKKLLAKIKAQADEITILNERLAKALNKLKIVEQADLIKYKLTPYCMGRSFREAIDDPSISTQIEEIFNAPLHKCLNIYNELTNKRNMITHKWTNRTWTEPTKKTNHGKSIQKLCSSVKSYELVKKSLDSL